MKVLKWLFSDANDVKQDSPIIIENKTVSKFIHTKEFEGLKQTVLLVNSLGFYVTFYDANILYNSIGNRGSADRLAENPSVSDTDIYLFLHKNIEIMSDFFINYDIETLQKSWLYFTDLGASRKAGSKICGSVIIMQKTNGIKEFTQLIEDSIYIVSQAIAHRINDELLKKKFRLKQYEIAKKATYLYLNGMKY